MSSGFSSDISFPRTASFASFATAHDSARVIALRKIHLRRGGIALLISSSYELLFLMRVWSDAWIRICVYHRRFSCLRNQSIVVHHTHQPELTGGIIATSSPSLITTAASSSMST